MSSFLKKRRIFSNLFPPPEYLLFSTSGVALTEDSIKFAQIKRNILGSGLRLVHSSRIAIPDQTIESGDIKNPQELANALRELSYRYGLDYIRATLPDEKAYLFHTTIDRVPQEGLEDAVAFVVEENVPLSLSESVFSFEVFGSMHGESKVDLIVTVLHRNVVESYTELLESVGLIPVSFDLESQAVARAVVKRGDRNSYLIANLFNNKTGFYVVDDGVVKFSITPTHGTNNKDNIEELRSEMKKVITFWNSHSASPDRKIIKVIFCGPGSRDLDFIGELMKGEETLYSLADVWTNLSYGKGKEPLTLEDSLEYADAIGLAFPHKEYVYV